MKTKLSASLSLTGILVSISFALAGCAAPPPRIVVQQVKVPVPVQVPCPAPSVPARPQLPIAGLQPGAAPADVVRAYVAMVAVLQGYAAQLEQLLGARAPGADQERRP